MSKGVWRARAEASKTLALPTLFGQQFLPEIRLECTFRVCPEFLIVFVTLWVTLGNFTFVYNLLLSARFSIVNVVLFKLLVFEQEFI